MATKQVVATETRAQRKEPTREKNAKPLLSFRIDVMDKETLRVLNIMKEVGGWGSIPEMFTEHVIYDFCAVGEWAESEMYGAEEHVEKHKTIRVTPIKEAS